MIELPEGSVDEIAPLLLGAKLRTEFEGVVTEVAIVEVEAYGGFDDPASHAAKGRSGRNASMFAPAGTLYVYRSYGVHWCANVVTGSEGRGEAVLLRAGVPLDGVAMMQQRRGRADHLCDGPGKLCQAMGITGDHDGTSLSNGPVRLALGRNHPKVRATARIGVSKATDRLWRYVVASAE